MADNKKGVAEKPMKKSKGDKVSLSGLAERFDEGGLEGFSAEEVLEFILEFSYTGDCQRAARGLMDKFGSLGRTLKADPRELRKIGGLDEQTAVLLKLIPEAIGVYSSEKADKRQCLGTNALMKIFYPCFVGAGEEKFMLACFDKRLGLISLNCVSSGSSAFTGAAKREIMAEIISEGCPMAALAHNHPYSGSRPSDEDISITRELNRAMSHVGVYLMDHVIIGEDGCYSMRSHGDIDLFD
ncbi:MAG: hypothetical protein K2K57_11580 [Oscillospiraceae bacterium]|nr:hypothetical protein [Oscillospiraceae bacterium]